MFNTTTSTQNPAKLAVLIDADNTPADIIEPLLEEIAKYGTVSVKRIYGDWSSTHLTKWQEKLLPHAIIPVQQFAYTKGKNATDISMVINAMDLLYSNIFNGFCIISSDSDFTPLASRIRENGISVYGFGANKTPEAFRTACDKFIYIENLLVTEKEEVPLQKIPSNKLKQDSGLLNLIRNAIKEKENDDGWASLGSVGQYMNGIKSDFDPRNYGYSKLSDLIRAIDLFEIKMIEKTMCIKTKNKDSKK